MAILRYSIFFFLSQKKIFSSFIFGFLNWLLLFDCLVLLPYTFFFFSCQHLMYNINKIIDVWLVVQRESSWFFLFKCKERKKSKSRSPSMCVCVIRIEIKEPGIIFGYKQLVPPPLTNTIRYQFFFIVIFWQGHNQVTTRNVFEIK